MATGEVLEHEWFEYDGPIAACKGDNTAKAAEVQQMQFSQQLMQVFQTQFGRQSAILNYLTGVMKPQVAAGGEGYSPAALNAMRASATDNISNEFNHEQQALNEREFAQGGRDLPSGVNAQINAGLGAEEAAQKAGAENQITLANEDLKQKNYWNAVNVLNGNAAQFAPNSYANSANQGSGEVANLSQAVTAANQSQLLGALGGIAGGAGSAIAGYYGKH